MSEQPDTDSGTQAKIDEIQVPPEGGHERDRDLAQIVNNIEESVTEERRSEGNPGNADDRAATEPVVSEDQAPE
ncbi:hypothetical protein [Antrihabitans spumae]|uniref:Uncharacterized protein n=1 Tax=Antrihabitans spumae TaxID=3373370 RepID=A0ABW7JR53_9NOCA